MIGLQPQGRAAMGTIPLRPELVELTGDYRYALLLQQLCYDTSRTPDGWVQKTFAELAQPFGSVTERTVRRWVDHMEAEGWIEVRREVTTSGRLNHYKPRRKKFAVIDAAVERSHGPSSIVSAGEKPQDKMSSAQGTKCPGGQDKMSHAAQDKMSSAPIREFKQSKRVRAHSDELVDICREVDRQTAGQKQIDTAEAEQLVELGNPADVVPVFVAKWKRYKSAAFYKLLGYCREQLDRDRSGALVPAVQAKTREEEDAERARLLRIGQEEGW